MGAPHHETWSVEAVPAPRDLVEMEIVSAPCMSQVTLVQRPSALRTIQGKGSRSARMGSAVLTKLPIETNDPCVPECQASGANRTQLGSIHAQLLTINIEHNLLAHIGGTLEAQADDGGGHFLRVRTREFALDPFQFRLQLANFY